MARASAPTKSTGGGGYTFADKVAAAFLAQMLKRAFPLETELGPIVGLHFETRESGQVLDDFLLILQRGTDTTRCVISVKSNRQLTNSGFSQEFVADAWEQRRRPASPNFNPETDLLGLTVGAIQDSTFHEWLELLKQVTSTTPERIVERLATSAGQTSATQRSIFESLQDPLCKGSPDLVETARLASKIRVLPFADASEGIYINLCAELVLGGTLAEGTKLWSRLVQLTDENRGTGGYFDLPKLVRTLRHDFELRDYPDYKVDWQRIEAISAANAQAIRVVIGQNIQLARATERANISAEIAAHDIVVLVGESGSGKSALIANLVSSEGAYKRLLWLTAEQLSKSSQTELANAFALRHAIPELIRNASLRGCLLVLDGFEKLEGEARQRALEFIAAVKDVGFVGWKLIITCQPQFAKSVQDALIEAGVTAIHRVDFEKPNAQEIYDAIPHLPEIRDLLARSHLQPILRNLVMLDWVLRTEIVERLSNSSTAWMGETHLINYIWDHWTGTGPMHFARDSLLRTLGARGGEKLSGAVHVDTIEKDQLPLLGTLEHDGLIRANSSSVLFRHDLMGDWARFRVLTYAGNDALRQIQALAPVPRWGHAIRLYAQSLAEKGDGLETWKTANSQFTGAGPDAQVVSDIFLDGLLFAANSEVLLEEVWLNLLADDGLVLKRLLQRLQHAASVPDFRIRLLVDPKLAEQSEAWFRIPVPIYWVPALAVFSRHSKDVATHALLLAAEVCALWLRTIPVGIRGRQEGAALAVELAKETQGRIAEGLRFGNKDKVVYEALLWAANEFPDEVSQIALELSGRRDEPEHAIWRGIEADEKRAREHQEWLAKHPEEKKRRRVPTPSLLTPYSEGPIRDAAADGPLREVSEGFRLAVLETGALKGLIAKRPDIAREVLLAVSIDEPKPMETHREMILRRDECGLADWRNGYPAAYWKGPFLLFLQDAPEQGLDAIIRLVNYATNRWLEDAVGHTLTGEEGRRYGLPFEIDGATKTWLGDCNTYGWHRSCSLHAPAVESALMALEKWLYGEVDGRRSVSRWLQTILNRAESLAFAGVLVSLGLKHPALFTQELQPFLGSIYLYECQLSWAVNEGHETWTIPLTGQGQVVERMTAEWNRMPHRRFLLQDVAPWLMHQDDGTRKYLASRKPEWKKALANRKDNPEALELLLSKLDPDSYTHTPEPDGMIRIEMRVPPHLEPKIKQAHEEGGRKMLAVALASRARQYLSSGNPLPLNDVPAFAADLQRLAEWQPPTGEEPLVQYRLNSIAGAIAVLIIQHRAWLAQNPTLETWCMDFLRTAGAGLESEYDSPVSALDHTAESFRGEAGVALLQESSDEWVLRLAFDGVTGFYYGSLLQSMWNGYLLRERLGDRFNELVNVVVLWSALRRAATRESGYQANRSLLEKYKGTLFRRFVTGRLRGRLIPLQKAERLGRSLVTRISRRTMSAGERLARQARQEYRRSEKRDRKLYRDLPDLDLEVLRKGFAFLPVMITDARPDEQDRLEEYLRELYVLELRTLPRPQTGEESFEIEGTAYDFDTWVLTRVTEFVSQKNSVELARKFYRPIIELGPAARYWVEDFLQAWITRGLEISTDLATFSGIWADIVGYAMSLPAWQPNEGNYWSRAESIVVDLMGLRDMQTLVLGQAKYRTVITAMGPTFQQWAGQWLKYGYVAAWFCRFLPTESGQLLLASGITLLADRVSSFRDNDWHDYSLGPLLTDALAACWRTLRNEVESQPSLREAFLRILTELCARQIPEALHLRNRVSGAAGSQKQQESA
jgi:hypothetical protein